MHIAGDFFFADAFENLVEAGKRRGRPVDIVLDVVSDDAERRGGQKRDAIP